MTTILKSLLALTLCAYSIMASRDISNPQQLPLLPPPGPPTDPWDYIDPNIDPNDPREDLGHIYKPFELDGTLMPWESPFSESWSLAKDILVGMEENQGDCHLHKRGCWGYYVVRTAFEDGDDDRVSTAMAKLNEAIEVSVRWDREGCDRWNSTPTPSESELKRRMHNHLVDNVRLKNATIKEIREYLNSWLNATLPEEWGGPRYTSFILLDSEVVENLNKLQVNQLTSDDQVSLWQHETTSSWVKLADFHDTGETCKAWVWDLTWLWREFCGDKLYGLEEVARIRKANADPKWLFYDNWRGTP